MATSIDMYVLGNAPGEATLDITDGGKQASGPAVAAQKFLIRLFTVRGNDPVDSNRGTDFMSAAYSGLLYSEPAVTMYFTIAAKEAIAQLEAEESSQTPADEKIYQVSTDSVTVTTDTISIAATLITRAGTSIAISVPVPYGEV